jgi:hypothetical protein
VLVYAQHIDAAHEFSNINSAALILLLKKAAIQGQHHSCCIIMRSIIAAHKTASIVSRYGASSLIRVMVLTTHISNHILRVAFQCFLVKSTDMDLGFEEKQLYS